MSIEAKCDICQYAIFDNLWGELKCKYKCRVCTESEMNMGCDDFAYIGTKPDDPTPEMIVRKGATFTPHVSEDGVISWTNDMGLTNPEPVKINGGSKGKIGWVTLLASGWTGKDSLYSQVVNVEGVTENSQVDLTPDVEQLAIFYNKDLTFVTENVGGVVTVYAIGQKPTNDYTIQVTITEVDI